MNLVSYRLQICPWKFQQGHQQKIKKKYVYTNDLITKLSFFVTTFCIKLFSNILNKDVTGDGRYVCIILSIY